MDSTPASTRGSGPSTSSRSCRSATTTMDDCVELARAFGERIATRFDLPVYLYAERRHAGPSGSSWPTSGAASTRASRREIDQPRPRARLRAGADAPVGRRRRGRRAAVPHRLQHQPRLARRRARQADRPARPRIGRRPAEGPGQRLLDRGAGPRPGLDEPPRLRDRRRCGWSGRRSATWPPRTASSSPSRS